VPDSTVSRSAAACPNVIALDGRPSWLIHVICDNLFRSQQAARRRATSTRRRHADATRLLNARFPSPLVLSSSRTRKLPDTLSRLGIAGGAVYDALVALAAKELGPTLATREARPRGTYDAVGVEVIVVT
jgi:toxin FitB